MRRDKRVHVFIAAGVLLLVMAGVQAQDVLGPALPPPSINAPGVQPVPASTAAAPESRRDTLPGTAAKVPQDSSLADVKTRTEGNDTVQEYSHNGNVYMIKVIPKHGVTQTYIDTDGDGRLDIKPGESPVAPVYYTLYEWGKPKTKPKSGDESATPDQR